MKNDIATKYCWSWDHLDLVDAAKDSYVCAEHQSEQPLIENNLQALSNIQRSIEKLLSDAAPKEHHPMEFLVLQDLLSDYFTESLPALKAGNSFRIDFSSKKRRELDIIVDLQSGDWLGRARRNIIGQPPLAHMEVAYRSAFDLRKLRKDFQSLHETVISGAVQDPPRKVWTAFVGLGSGWNNRRKEIFATVHEYFHDRIISTIESANSPDFLDVPDILILPGLVLMKHKYVSERGSIQTWPVYVELPSALNDPAHVFRPLSIARGHFIHFLRGVLNQGKAERELCPKGEISSIFGPNFRINYEATNSVSLDHAPLDLFARDPQHDGRTKYLHYRALNVTCSTNAYYWYQRIEGSSLDESFLTII